MSRPKEITRLAWVAEPSVGVVTNVAPVHLEFFESIEKIAQAKKELIDALPPDGLAVLNAEDERVMAMSQGFKGRVLTYGMEAAHAHVRGHDVRTTREGGMTCKVSFRGERSVVTLGVALPGRHNLSNALAAMACAKGMGADLESAAERIGLFSAMDGRGRIVRLQNGITLFDDSYNSSPVAFVGSVRAAAAMKKASSKLVVFSGDMLELGPTGPDIHRHTGESLAGLGVDRLIGIGPLSEHLIEGAGKAGVAQCRVFESAEEALQHLTEYVEADAMILVKGSRGIKTDLIVKRLEEELS